MNSDDYYERLRHQAEQKLKVLDIPETLEQLSEHELKECLHQLDVYRIELEMQNRELLETHQQLVDALKQQRQQRAFFQALYDEAPVGYLLLDMKGLILDANAFFYDKMGVNEMLTRGRPFSKFIHEADQAAFVVRYPAFFKQPSNKIINVHLCKKGRIIPFAITGNRVSQSDYGENLLRLVLMDTSENEQLQHELRLTSKVFEYSTHGILISNQQNRIIKINPAFTNLLGYDLDDVRGKDPSILNAQTHDAAYYQAMWEDLKKQGFWHGEMHNRKKNGDICEYEVTMFVLTNNHNEITHYIATYQDITDKKRAYKLVEHLAEYDQLTDLPNRRLLSDRLSQSIKLAQRQHEKLAVLFLDLDHFKSLNDSYGHLVGDELLRQIAARLRSCLRDADTLARFGGDEFVIVLANLQDESNARNDVAQISQKLLRELAAPFQLAETTYQTTFSIGIAMYPDDGECESILLQKADTAMYDAKINGRNKYSFFNNQQQYGIRTRHELQQSLRHAFEKNEFRLYYQLQSDLRSGQIVGMETLIRWMHPTRGMLLPEQFLYLAEEHGCMPEIDRWVIQETCRQLQEWLKLGLPIVPVSVNMTQHQFAQGSQLPEILEAMLQQYQIPPHLFKVEVTEGSVIQDIEAATQVLNALVAMQVQIALDDFGTGYSSLTYLRRLPVNLLKIDQSFVKNVLLNQNDQIIIKATIAMTQAMGIKILAEGVETDEQASYLEEIGCNFGQGYLYSRPLSARHITELFASKMMG